MGEAAFIRSRIFQLIGEFRVQHIHSRNHSCSWFFNLEGCITSLLMLSCAFSGQALGADDSDLHPVRLEKELCYYNSSGRAMQSAAVFVSPQGDESASIERGNRLDLSGNPMFRNIHIGRKPSSYGHSGQAVLDLGKLRDQGSLSAGLLELICRSSEKSYLNHETVVIRVPDEGLKVWSTYNNSSSASCVSMTMGVEKRNNQEATQTVRVIESVACGS